VASSVTTSIGTQVILWVLVSNNAMVEMSALLKCLFPGWLQATIGHDGTRSTAATSYLTPDVRARDNLHIVTDTRVTHVLSTEGASGLEVLSVEIGSPDSSDRVVLTASKEVILSAGAIGTPQILLNSGIGDQEDLKAFDIALDQT
jgi:choline dehydrogenase